MGCCCRSLLLLLPAAVGVLLDLAAPRIGIWDYIVDKPNAWMRSPGVLEESIFQRDGGGRLMMVYA